MLPAIGTTITTSSGYTFTLVGLNAADFRQSWRDNTTGITWHDLINNDFTFYRANLYYDRELPTVNDWTTAETHGIREVVPNMKGYLYWPQDHIEGLNHQSLFFNGNTGQMVYNPSTLGAVRTIERRK